MNKFFHSFCLPAAMAVLIGLSNCGYQEQNHANTPPETPGSQNTPGVDTVVHPGNIDKDSIHLHE